MLTFDASVTDRDGRKVFVNGALYGADGRRLAAARNTWIIVPPEVQKGAV